jgi:hypothetical protein
MNQPPARRKPGTPAGQTQSSAAASSVFDDTAIPQRRSRRRTRKELRAMRWRRGRVHCGAARSTTAIARAPRTKEWGIGHVPILGCLSAGQTNVFKGRAGIPAHVVGVARHASQCLSNDLTVSTRVQERSGRSCAPRTGTAACICWCVARGIERERSQMMRRWRWTRRKPQRWSTGK